MKVQVTFLLVCKNLKKKKHHSCLSPNELEGSKHSWTPDGVVHWSLGINGTSDIQAKHL